MNRVKSHSIVLLGVIAWSLSVHASSPDIGTNDVQLMSDGSYALGKQDAFFVVKTTAKEPTTADAGSRYLIIDISLTGSGSDSKIPMEIFFERIDGNSGYSFDPLYRLQFNASPETLQRPTSQLAIALPAEVEIKAEQSLRLDIDACSACVVRLRSPIRVTSELDSKSASADIIHPVKIFNGARAIPDNGLSLSPSQWLLNDLDALSEQLVVNGGDPYLVSPDLSLATSNLGGVRFKLSRAGSDLPTANFQIFHATDTHAFIEMASTFAQVPVDETGQLDFVIPLRFLSNEQPAAFLLSRLRLDLIPQTTPPAVWSLDAVEILSERQVSEYKQLIPKRIVQSKSQRARGLGLLVKIIKKITSDLGFTMFYLLTLVITAALFWRQFKR